MNIEISVHSGSHPRYINFSLRLTSNAEGYYWWITPYHFDSYDYVMFNGEYRKISWDIYNKYVSPTLIFEFCESDLHSLSDGLCFAANDRTLLFFSNNDEYEKYRKLLIEQSTALILSEVKL